MGEIRHWQCAVCSSWSSLSPEDHQCCFSEAQQAFKRQHGVYPHEVKNVAARAARHVHEKAAQPPTKRRKKKPSPAQVSRDAEDRAEFYRFGKNVIFEKVKKEMWSILDGFGRD